MIKGKVGLKLYMMLECSIPPARFTLTCDTNPLTGCYYSLESYRNKMSRHHDEPVPVFAPYTKGESNHIQWLAY